VTTTVGIIGLGLLGQAVASRLLQAGHSVVGYDVMPDRVEALAARGGVPAPSAEAVAGRVEILFTILPTLASVEAAILGDRGVVAGGPAPGLTLVQMSTISPALTVRLAREFAARGVAFLDCPVSGTSVMVARGEGILLVGGAPTVFERWRTLLETILPRAVHIGRAGQAMVVKLAANLLVGLHTAAAGEALSLVRKAGLDPARVLDVLTASAGSSRMLELRGPLMVRGEFPAQMKLELFLKDLGLILDAGLAAGAPLPLTALAQRLFAAALADGHGDEDLAVVATALEKWPERER
jgi:3-hydroxyisobutyrate dehydrogenase-like beta-hydroxyacid dehydrogenase